MPMFDDDRDDHFDDLTSDPNSDPTFDDIHEDTHEASMDCLNDLHGLPPSISGTVALPDPDIIASPIIPGLFPRNTISFLVHTPFSGSTRFILPQFDNYTAGLPFLGFAVPDKPEQLGMILCSRDRIETKVMLHDLDLSHLSAPGTFPVVKWSCNLDDQIEPLHEFPLEASYKELTRLADGREPRFLLVESIQLLAPQNKLNDPHAVVDLFNRLKQFCRDRDCTILGTAIMSKTESSDRRKHIPYRIYGAAQWTMGASSIIALEEYNDTSTLRKVVILSKTAHQKTPPLWVDFDLQGRLMPCAAPENRRDTAQSKLDETLAIAEPGAQFTRADFLNWGESLGVGTRTIDRWIQACVQFQILKKEGSTTGAIYTKSRPN
jgi:hypothetical protein